MANSSAFCCLLLVGSGLECCIEFGVGLVEIMSAGYFEGISMPAELDAVVKVARCQVSAVCFIVEDAGEGNEFFVGHGRLRITIYEVCLP